MYLLPVAALLLVMLQSYRTRLRDSKYYFAIILSILYSVIIYFVTGITIGEYLFLMGVAVIGTNLIYSYASHRVDFSIGIIIALLGFVYWLTLPQTPLPFIELFAVGSLIGILLRFGYVQRVSHEDKKLEKERDIFQIVIGVIALAAFVLLVQYAYIAVFLLVLCGYVVSGLLLNHRATGFLRALERKGSVFGAGALYMAVGTMLILGSIPNRNYVIVSLVALLICDAVATIVGVHGRRKLPYNKGKTVEGTLAYFATLAIIGFPFVSYYSILFAAVLAVLEGAISSVDDNISIPIAAIILYRIILL